MFKFMSTLFGDKPSEVAPTEQSEQPSIVSTAPAPHPVVPSECIAPPIHRGNSPKTTTARDRSEVHVEISSPLSPPIQVGHAVYSSSDDTLSRSHYGGFSSGDSYDSYDSYDSSSSCSSSDSGSTGSGDSD
ncbi:hypothetical protein SAMN05216593_1134 [Pseudomonas asturiensis]|uniref:Uncharacterized protein n=1 Tax=Pseudomonas asturiensis TaxID=1190415 RepID=A0A1M7PS83_9PSED|nr:hypothetical protein SAMN05216593_1134 [Pseudomonas asturiensis]